MKRIMIVFVAALMVMTLPSFAHANLLSNAGFEDGDLGQFAAGNTTTLVPGWEIWGTDGWHHNDYNHTTGGAKGVKTYWDSAGMFQDFSAAAGTSYDFSAYALTPSSNRLAIWNGVYNVEWFDTTSKIGQAEIGRFNSATDAADTWKLISKAETAPTGAIKGRVVLGITGYNTGVFGELGWDDVSVNTTIPEPTSLLLLGSGLAGMLGLRKRK